MKRVRGHERLEQAFARILEQGRLGHAYLFTGPGGIGKHAFAAELARTLLCEGTPSGVQACDQCPSCLLMDGGTHPDFIDVGRPEDSLELPIEVIRDLCRTFALKPARSSRKVAILNDADDLNEAAANCFLKTLEEPPPGAVLLLVGTNAERQLPTIRSRCQLVPFEPLPDKLVADLLQDHDVERGQIDRLVRLGSGSVGRALDLADPAIWEARQTIVKALAQPKPDAAKLAKTWQKFAEEAGSESSAQRRQSALVLRLVIDFFRNVLHVKVGKTPAYADPQDLSLMKSLADRLDEDRLLEIIERGLQADEHIDRRVQLVLILESVADALSRQLT